MKTRPENVDVSPWRLRLREAREALALTQEDLGRLIGKSKSAIQSWETADGNEPSIGDSMALARVLGAPVSWLIYGDATPEVVATLRLRGRLREFRDAVDVILATLDGTIDGNERRDGGWPASSRRRTPQPAPAAT